MRFSVVSKSDIQFYENCGYLQIDDMFSDVEISKLKKAAGDIVESEDPYKDITQFTSGADGRGQSFIDSGD